MEYSLLCCNICGYRMSIRYIWRVLLSVLRQAHFAGRGFAINFACVKFCFSACVLAVSALTLLQGQLAQSVIAAV
ncbi:MAG: hypothetical protein DU430_03990 [Candidatus Tokpelaia sp.]|nr:MAG: hypothetical protein DU430_03990 [Candidatus Tokpelaia sp.]